jgi:Mg2+-importing ATPase
MAFGALIFILHASPAQFRTMWFMESVMSASIIVLVIRTRRPFFKSLPGKSLLGATVLVAIATAAIPYIPPLARILGFEPLGPEYWLFIAGIVALYVISAEITKRIFYRMVKF